MITRKQKIGVAMLSPLYIAIVFMIPIVSAGIKTGLLMGVGMTLFIGWVALATFLIEDGEDK